MDEVAPRAVGERVGQGDVAFPGRETSLCESRGVLGFLSAPSQSIPGGITREDHEWQVVGRFGAGLPGFKS